MTAATRCRVEAALLKPDTERVSVRIRRVSTTRAGGVSVPPFDTFNLGDHVGDDPAAVAANRIRLAAAIGLGLDRVGWMNQVHGDHIEVVDGPRETAFDDTDGLVTRTPRLALAVVTADCVPVLLGDARAGVVAAVHAGRGGARGRAGGPRGGGGPGRRGHGVGGRTRAGHLGAAGARGQRPPL